jgi:integrase/recombinase XerD
MQVSFWLRKVAKTHVVYGAISVNGERKQGAFSTGIKVQKSLWSAELQRIVDKNGKIHKAHVDNLMLEKIYEDIKTIYLQLTAIGKPITAQKLRDYYLNGFDFSEKPFLVYAKEFIAAKSKLIGRGITKATVTTAQQRLNRIEKWLVARRKTTILLSEVKVRELKDFAAYQLTEAEVINNKKRYIGYDGELVRKDVGFFKSIIKSAFEEELIDKNVIRDTKIQIPVETKDIIFLETFELDAIHYHNFASKKLQEIADLFVFQSYTGFAYVDLMSFNQDNDVFIGTDGKHWISKHRGKSKVESLLPFFKKARNILEKLNGVLPRLSNGHYNDYLKEIAVITGIKKHLTTHVARRTAAMMFLEHGCDLDNVARMCGHNNAMMTKRYYTKIRIQRISAQLDNAGRLEW